MVVRIQIASKTVQTAENWEIESKEDHLLAIKLREYTTSWAQVRTRKLGDKNILVIWETSTSSKTIHTPETKDGKRQK